MTNDTTTLNGSLQELGETMADNLTTMGVTASASDGLTTLANKILQISPVTPTVTITLTGDKSILSYSNSESVTLSATVLENGSGKSGVTVEFFKGSTSLGTATTNSSGVATKSYSATGSGDVSFTATYSNVTSSAVTVEDCIYYNATEITQSLSGGGDHFTALNSSMSLSLPSKFELTFDCKSTSTGSRFGLVPVANKSSNNPTYALLVQQLSDIYVGVYRDSSTHAVGSNTSTTGTNYHNWKITRDTNTVKWYFDDSQINSNITLSWIDSHNPYLLGFQYWQTGSMSVKNIKIKAL